MSLIFDFSWRRLATTLACVGAVLLCAAGFVGSAHAASTIFATTGSGPIAIAIDPAGNVYTANFNSNDVSKITPAGVTSTLGTTGGGPNGIAIDKAGNIYTANQDSNNVSKITPGGVTTTLGTTGTAPDAIATRTVDSTLGGGTATPCLACSRTTATCLTMVS